MRHSANRHDLRRITRARAADARLQDVVADLYLLPGVEGIIVLRREGWYGEAVRPEMVLRRARRSAFATHRLMHKEHQGDEAGRIGVLREVDLGIELGQCFPQRRLHPPDCEAAEEPVAVCRAERILCGAAAARAARVVHLVAVEIGVPEGLALNVENAVRHLIVERAVGVGPSGRGSGGKEYRVVTRRDKGRRR